MTTENQEPINSYHSLNALPQGDPIEGEDPEKPPKHPYSINNRQGKLFYGGRKCARVIKFRSGRRNCVQIMRGVRRGKISIAEPGIFKFDLNGKIIRYDPPLSERNDKGPS